MKNENNKRDGKYSALDSAIVATANKAQTKLRNYVKNCGHKEIIKALNPHKVGVWKVNIATLVIELIGYLTANGCEVTQHNAVNKIADILTVKQTDKAGIEIAFKIVTHIVTAGYQQSNLLEFRTLERECKLINLNADLVILKEKYKERIMSNIVLPSLTKPKQTKIKVNYKKQHIKPDQKQTSQKVIDSINRLQQVQWCANYEQINYINRNIDSLCSLWKEDEIKAIKAAIEDVNGLPKIFYFHLQVDTRGRFYYMGSHINPQKSDAIKSMLMFSKGENLTKRGLERCYAYLASLYGNDFDKLPLNEQIEKGKYLMKCNKCYTEADEPFQYRACHVELKKAIENPNYEFRMPIYLDASSSGSQFISCLMGDKKGALLSNVLGSENGSRSDIYQALADYTLHGVIDSNMITILNEGGRSIAKAILMVDNYGASTRTMIDKSKSKMIELFNNKYEYDTYFELSKIMVENVSKILPSSTIYKQTLNSYFNTRSDSVIEWFMPDNFIACNGKKKRKKETFTLMIDGSRHKMDYYFYLDELDKQASRNSFAANFIHSLDATLLRMTANKSDFDMVTIHDAFGCLPNNVDEMLDNTKESFKEIIKSNPMQLFNSEIKPLALHEAQIGDYFFS